MQWYSVVESGHDSAFMCFNGVNFLVALIAFHWTDKRFIQRCRAKMIYRLICMACDIDCIQIDSYPNKSHANYSIFRHFSQFSHCLKCGNVEMCEFCCVCPGTILFELLLPIEIKGIFKLFQSIPNCSHIAKRKQCES